MKRLFSLCWVLTSCGYAGFAGSYSGEASEVASCLQTPRVFKVSFNIEATGNVLFISDPTYCSPYQATFSGTSATLLPHSCPDQVTPRGPLTTRVTGGSLTRSGEEVVLEIHEEFGVPNNGAKCSWTETAVLVRKL